MSQIFAVWSRALGDDFTTWEESLSLSVSVSLDVGGKDCEDLLHIAKESVILTRSLPEMERESLWSSRCVECVAQTLARERMRQ